MYLNLKVPREIHLSNSLIENVKYVVVQAEREVANDILKLPQDVVILIDTDPNMIDPNIGVGGYTNDKNQIQLSINPKHKNINAREILPLLYTSLAMLSALMVHGTVKLFSIILSLRDWQFLLKRKFVVITLITQIT